MKLTTIFSLLIIAFTFGCGTNSGDGNFISHEQMLEKDRMRTESEQKLYERKDEFATMTAPFKEKRPYFVKDAFMLVRMPGHEYEALGWEKDGKGGMTKCLFDKCNGREVFWVKDMLPKDDVVKSVIRADCRAGKELSKLGLAPTIVTGSIHAATCDIVIIDLESQTTVAKGQILADEIKTTARGEIPTGSVVQSIDKKSYIVAPYEKIGDFQHQIVR